jgi:hypothetical protein
MVGVLLNGPVSLGFSIGALTLMTSLEVALGLLALLPVLLLASVINVALGIILFKSLEKVWDVIK